MSHIAARSGPGNPCPCCRSETKGCSTTHDGAQYCRGCPGEEWIVLKEGDTFKTCRRKDDQTNLRERVPRAPKEKAAPAKKEPEQTAIDWRKVVEGYKKETYDEHRAHFLSDLDMGDLPNETVNGLFGFGCCGRGNRQDRGAYWTYAWAEFDGLERVIGLATRIVFDSGKSEKGSFSGSRRGLTFTRDWRARALRDKVVFVPEGMSDSLALWAAGLCAVGRPSADGGADHLAELMRALPPDVRLVVLGENDICSDGSSPGAKCEPLAEQVARSLNRPVAFAYPPDDIKDVRLWLTSADRGAQPWEQCGQELRERLLAGAKIVEPNAPVEFDDWFTEPVDIAAQAAKAKEVAPKPEFVPAARVGTFGKGGLDTPESSHARPDGWRALLARMRADRSSGKTWCPRSCRIPQQNLKTNTFCVWRCPCGKDDCQRCAHVKKMKQIERACPVFARAASQIRFACVETREHKNALLEHLRRLAKKNGVKKIGTQIGEYISVQARKGGGYLLVFVNAPASPRLTDIDAHDAADMAAKEIEAWEVSGVDPDDENYHPVWFSQLFPSGDIARDMLKLQCKIDGTNMPKPEPAYRTFRDERGKALLVKWPIKKIVELLESYEAFGMNPFYDIKIVGDSRTEGTILHASCLSVLEHVMRSIAQTISCPLPYTGGGLADFDDD